MQVVAGLFVLLLVGTIAAARDGRCNQEQARQEMQKLTAAGAIISVSQFLPNVTVVVDERRWNRTSDDERKAIAWQIDCAVAGPDSTMLRRVVFRSSGGNQVIASYSSTELTPP